MNLNMLYVCFLFALVSLSHCDKTENVASWEVKTLADCPGQGYSTYGYWTVSYNNGARCVLVCKDGYEPDNCHVLRKIGTDKWNGEIVQCVKKSWIPSWKTLAVAGAAGAGAVVAAPVAIPTWGFSVIAGGLFAPGAIRSFFGGVTCEEE